MYRIAGAMNLPDARALAAELRQQRRNVRALLVALKGLVGARAEKNKDRLVRSHQRLFEV